MKRLLRRLGILLLVLVGTPLVLVLAYLSMNWEHARRFPKIISAYYAKEACTCRFVLERDEAACHQMVRQYVPIRSYKEDLARREIIVTGLWQRSRARHVDARLGCRLEE